LTWRTDRELKYDIPHLFERRGDPRAMKLMLVRLPLICLCFGPLHLSAQTLVYPPIASFSQAWGAEVSHSLPSDISRGSTGLGEMDATHARFGWLGTMRSAGSRSLLAGFEWRGSAFDSPAGAPIPDAVHSIALKLGGEWRMNEKWTLRFEADPGLYSDFEDITGDDFNAPLALRLTWAQNSNLTWVVGIGVDWRSGTPVIGGPGVRWRFAPDWTLNLIMPRPRIEFSPNRMVTVFAGGELKSGSWRVSEDFGQRSGDSQLDNEIVDYRESRAGAGVRLRLWRNWSASLDGGWVLDRRFNFDRENLLLNGDGAPYVQFGVLAVF
jgi:hypothetical protein